MNNKKIAIIGAGISGLSSAKELLNKGFDVKIFEKNAEPGGLIRCTQEDGNLFHRVGGHVFNSKIQKVNEWFWNCFESESEFTLTDRNAKILYNNKLIGYPFENYLYELPEDIVEKIIADLLNTKNSSSSNMDFQSFLINSFGTTLYELYFEPYNKKIWNQDLGKIPLPWLEGKLPMPNVNEIIKNNIIRKEESKMVHRQFYYPNTNGSSFIANRLSQNINIKYNTSINSIIKNKDKWIIDGEIFDIIIYTADVRNLHKTMEIDSYVVGKNLERATSLKSNGTSNVLCYTDKTDLSWLYIPDKKIKCHRIIYTGNFSKNNNKSVDKNTCTVEFSGLYEKRHILTELNHLPGNLKPIAFNYEPNSYVIHNIDTSDIIESIKKELEPLNFYLVGRFAEWEYFNMDTAINSALTTVEKIHKKETLS